MGCRFNPTTPRTRSCLQPPNRQPYALAWRAASPRIRTDVSRERQRFASRLARARRRLAGRFATRLLHAERAADGVVRSVTGRLRMRRRSLVLVLTTLRTRLLPDTGMAADAACGTFGFLGFFGFLMISPVALVSGTRCSASKPGSSSRRSVCLISASIAASCGASSAHTRDTATPLAPARPVRPMRCT